MGRPRRFAPEVRERAVRMVEEHREAHVSEWAVLQSVAPKLGCSGAAGYGSSARPDDQRARAAQGVRAGESRAEAGE